MLLVDLGATPLETSISGNTVDRAAVYSPVSVKSSRGSLGTYDLATDGGAVVHVIFILRVKFNCEPRARSVHRPDRRGRGPEIDLATLRVHPARWVADGPS